MSVSDEESFVILGSSPSMPSSLNAANDKSCDKSEISLESAQSSNEDLIVGDRGPENIKNMLQSAIFVNSEQTLIPPVPAKESVKNVESLASSFLLGEINSDVLKTSVYSQFPSFCSFEECAGDVAKLQNFMSEYMQLKNMLSKVNATMKQIYIQNKGWKEEIDKQQKLCVEQIEKLRTENEKLKCDLETKLQENINKEEFRIKEHYELIESVSEKATLIKNMSKQIEKLEEQQLDSSYLLPSKNLEYVPLSEHQCKIKDIERKLSELFGENLDLKDVQKQYIDEITCLKVNLVAGEELIKQSRSDIELLQIKNKENKDIFSQYEIEKCQMKEEIAILRQQVDVYCKDFEIERNARQNLAGEKDQLLSDLRSLQRKNHELIIEEQKRLQKTSYTTSRTARTPNVLKQQSINNSSLKTKEMPTTSQTAVESSIASNSTQTASTDLTNRCPICDTKFESLNVLQKHVNECLDKN